MLNKNKQVLKEFASSVKNKFSEAIVWGFGSRVNGNFSEESDLDVCIVTERMDDNIDRDIMDIAWNVGYENDIVISTVTYDRRTFESKLYQYSPLIKNITKNGILV